MAGRKKGTLKTGGRQKGTPNKDASHLMAKADELGVDPFEILLRFAKGDWKGLGYAGPTKIVAMTKSGDEILGDTISSELRAQSAKEACQYIYPKRKAIEHSTDEQSGFRVILEDYLT